MTSFLQSKEQMLLLNKISCMDNISSHRDSIVTNDSEVVKVATKEVTKGKDNVRDSYQKAMEPIIRDIQNEVLSIPVGVAQKNDVDKALLDLKEVQGVFDDLRRILRKKADSNDLKTNHMSKMMRLLTRAIEASIKNSPKKEDADITIQFISKELRSLTSRLNSIKSDQDRTKDKFRF